MTKLTKNEVSYSKGHQDSHCGKVFADDKGYCTHYRRITDRYGKCVVTEGDINPVYWCSQFKKAKQ